MTDIFHEVEEDLRNAHYRRLWSRYGPPLLAIIVIVIVGATGFAVWENFQQSRREAQSKLYQELIAAEPGPTAIERASRLAELEGQVSGGYKSIVRMDRATALVEAQKWDEARALFVEIAADGSVARSLRDVAQLKAALLNAETATLEEMREMLGELATPEHPLRFSAGELLGYVAYRVGDLDAAAAYCDAVIQDPTAPPDLLQRVTDLAAVIAGLRDGSAPQGSESDMAPAQEPASVSISSAEPTADIGAETNQPDTATEQEGE